MGLQVLWFLHMESTIGQERRLHFTVVGVTAWKDVPNEVSEVTSSCKAFMPVVDGLETQTYPLSPSTDCGSRSINKCFCARLGASFS